MAAKKGKPPVVKETSRVLSEDGDLENWADQPDSEAFEAAAKICEKIDKCFSNKDGQDAKVEGYWNIFNAIPDENRQYEGNSTAYIPEVRTCIQARVKRSLKQLFPDNRKHVDAVGTDAETPYPMLALLEHYIRKTDLKNVVRADLIAGDVTGQWLLYIDWSKTTRQIRHAVRRPKILEDGDLGQVPDIEIEDPEGETEEKLEAKEMIEEHPVVMNLPVEDFAIYPPTEGDPQRAIATAVKLRMTKDRLQQLMDEGVFVGDSASDLFDELAADDNRKKSPAKKRTSDAGIKTEGTYKMAVVYEIHCDLPLEDDPKAKEPCYVYYAGNGKGGEGQRILGIIRNPLWSGKRPVLSCAVDEITGSHFGRSKIEPVAFLQYNLNDCWNMTLDAAQYSLLPIVMTDPQKQPNYQSMVMGLAAVWLTDPQSTQFAQFPALYKDAIPLCNVLQQHIREALDVNDAMLGKQPAGRKNAAAVGAQAQDQQINITDHADRYEERMLNPLLELFFEMDQQFRTEDVTVMQRGELGVRAKMTKIEPQQFGERYEFVWMGTLYTMGVQKMQQQIAWLNVLRGIPPQQLAGRRLDITPIIEAGTDLMFGPEVAPRVLIDERNLYTIDPAEENTMLANGFMVQVHQGDNDVEHLQAHQSVAVHTGDPTGHIRAHIQQHMAALQAKRQTQMAQQQKPQGQPGMPGGAAPGVAGTPRMGAQPGQPRMQQPPGAVHVDQMADPTAAARG